MPDDIPNITRQRKGKNRPLDTAWRQQKLSAKRPVLTIEWVFIWILLLGFVIFGLGLLLYFSVNKSLEQVIPYTHCRTDHNVSASDLALLDKRPQCSIGFNLPETFKPPVKFYYQLDGFYQNFRTYLSSRNDQQLTGDLYKTDGCKPLDCEFAPGYTKDNASCNEDNYKLGRAFPYVPCGVIANSMFNDTFEILYNPPPESNETTTRVPFTTDGVLSDQERKKKFGNPSKQKFPGASLCDQFKNTAKPPSWAQPVCELGVFNNDTDTDRTDDPQQGLENIDFMVWMKAAALPSFRKTYRFLDKDVEFFKDGLPAGNYTLIINYNYPVKEFKITKYFVITHETWIGPRNFFLPIIYMVTGVFIVISSTALFLFAKCRARFSK